MSLIAITSQGIGKQVGMRRVFPGWVLAPTEYIVSDYTDGDVLAADGVSLEPAANEIQPTDAERIDSAFSQTDAGHVIKAMFLDFENRISAVEGKGAKTEIETSLKNKLP